MVSQLEKKTLELLDFYTKHSEIKPHPFIKALLLAFAGSETKSEGQFIGMDPPYAVVLEKRLDGHIVPLRVMSGTTTLTKQTVHQLLESEIRKVRALRFTSSP